MGNAYIFYMKKYLIKVSFTFLIFLIFLSKEVVFASLPLSGKVIVLDPGHGGLDPGSIYQNIYEKDINLAIALRLANELRRLGASVILIRNGDYDLSKPNAYMRKKSDFDNRIKIINQKNVDYYFSIHLNYLLDSRYYGPQVFYNNNNENNKKIAEQIQDSLNKELQTNRKVKKIPTKTYMYGKLKTEGVLIECGFLSNAYERNLLISANYQKKFAKLLANSIKELKL